jgi:hypothetical protein
MNPLISSFKILIIVDTGISYRPIVIIGWSKNIRTRDYWSQWIWAFAKAVEIFDARFERSDKTANG